jgi:hypothetical protein
MMMMMMMMMRMMMMMMMIGEKYFLVKKPFHCHRMLEY